MQRLQFFLEYESFEDNLIKYECLSCNKDNSNKVDEDFEKRFKNTFEFSNDDISKFILLWRKGVYSYEYIDALEKFNETSLPKTRNFKYGRYYICRLHACKRSL